MTQLAKWLTLPQLNSTCSYWGHSVCKNKSDSSKISTYLMVEINCKVFKICWYVCCWPRPRKVCAGLIFWVWPFNHLRSVAGFCAFCWGGWGWGGGRGWSTPPSLIQEGSSRRSSPYLLHTIFTVKVPLSYTFYWQLAPLSYTQLENCIPF